MRNGRYIAAAIATSATRTVPVETKREQTLHAFALFCILKKRRAISRVMSWMIIYLAATSPLQSSNLPGQCCLSREATDGPPICPVRSCFGCGLHGPGCYHPGGGLLHRLCTLTGVKPAVYFCCTFLGVASTGRYPASCPLKPGLSSPAAFRLCSRDHLPVFRRGIIPQSSRFVYKLYAP